MQKVKQQVFLTAENYIAVIKYMQENRLSNTSRAINELVTKYHQERDYYRHNIGKLQERLTQYHRQIEDKDLEIRRLNKRIRELKGIEEDVN